jgi:hypothetical protein
MMMNHPTDKDQALQGEGNYDASRRYDKAAHEFAESGQVEAAARAARPMSPEEAEAMHLAELAGKSHSKGEDPAVTAPQPAAK